MHQRYDDLDTYDTGGPSLPFASGFQFFGRIKTTVQFIPNLVPLCFTLHGSNTGHFSENTCPLFLDSRHWLCAMAASHDEQVFLLKAMILFFFAKMISASVYCTAWGLLIMHGDYIALEASSMAGVLSGNRRTT